MQSMIERRDLYVGGKWVAPIGSGMIEVINSTTEEVMATIPDGSAADVDAAVCAAREAFQEWSTTPPAERAEWSRKIADGFSDRMEEIATLTSQEVGMVKKLSLLIQAGLSQGSFAAVPELIEHFSFEHYIANSLVLREPVGVVGCITPWNYPLPQSAAKVALALAAGCTVVLKPSEVAPLTTFVMAEIIDQAGLPPGVFNLVSGTGPVAGEALASHPDVDMVSFTGSTRSGKRVAELCAQRVARVALELGGKSASIILEGADLQRAVRDGVSKAFLNSGQTCSALTRMVVPRSKLDEVERTAVQKAETLIPGDPFDSSSRIGPLASQAQWERVQGYIERGIDEGARLVSGGLGKPEGLDRGYFVKPTIFSDVRRDMVIAQEEIFGPVLSILPYADEREAVEIANDSQYGLAGAVWAESAERGIEVAKQIRTGQMEINGGAFNPAAPFGGYKQSGVGREYGEYGLAEFLEVKSLQL
jgi:acyl-CoA reductase-like NAD-dependent aldehyde dehydrogenase